MRICIFGGTGFIGRRLSELLVADGYEVLVFSRNYTGFYSNPGNIRIIEWSAEISDTLLPYFKGDYSIINLAGENIGSGLWLKSKKERILNSRIGITGLIREACIRSAKNPKCIIQGSASGFYGSGNELITEESQKGNGFLADVTDRWEKIFRNEDRLRSRIVFIRTGLVLGKDAGLLNRMLPAFRLYSGGYPGKGNQYLPWIHIEDEVNAIRFLLRSETAKGPYNLCSPNPVTFRTFCKTMSLILHKPCWLRIPPVLLRILPGNMGRELFLSNQQIIPEKLLNEGFNFSFPNIKPALENLLNT